jgi:hypothetical protein
MGRYLRFGWDDDGNLVGHFQLPAEQGAVLARVIAAYVDEAAISDADSDGAADPFSAAQADALVELVRIGQRAGEDEECADGDSGVLVTVIAEQSVLEADHPSGQNDSEPGVCEIENGPGLAAETARRLACDATSYTSIETPDGRVLDIGRSSRRPNRAMRRGLRRRDKHCQFPGCMRRSVQAHHIWHWIDGGHTKLDNLICLCPRHHHRLHEGGYRIVVDDRGQARFYHPLGYEIPNVPELGPATSPDSDLLGVDPFTSGWEGDRLDLGLVIDCLTQDDERATDDSAESGLGPAPVDIWSRTRIGHERELVAHR